jgi:hypothetical protein
MPIPDIWIIRALVARLRQPGMRAQRRLVIIVGSLMALFFIGAMVYLFRQPTEDAFEQAALRVFVVMFVFIAILIAAAIVVRKRTGASWSQEEALEMADERRENQRQ